MANPQVNFNDGFHQTTDYTQVLGAGYISAPPVLNVLPVDSTVQGYSNYFSAGGLGGTLDQIFPRSGLTTATVPNSNIIPNLVNDFEFTDYSNNSSNIPVFTPNHPANNTTTNANKQNYEVAGTISLFYKFLTAPTGSGGLADFLSSYTTPAITLTSDPLASFFSAWHTYAINNNGFLGGNISSVALPTTATDAALSQGIAQDFATMLGIGNSVNGTPSDWADINETANPGTVTSTLTTQPGNGALGVIFGNFLTSLKSTQSTKPITGIDNFVQKFQQFIAPFAVIMDSTKNYVAPDGTRPFTGMISYQGIYQALGPTNGDFQTNLNAFVQQEITAKGYFLPSQDVGDWLQYVSQPSGLASPQPITDQSFALYQNDGFKAQVMNRILALLITLIGTLQQVGISQANRLQYLTQYQNAYTALEGQVPVFLAGAPVIGASDSFTSTNRNDLNSTFNSNLSDSIRSFRGVQENNAKQVQSNLNTTNDQVNNQTDMVTSFIQQLSTLASTILR